MWAILDETVLRRVVGSPDIMSEQLAQLVSQARNSNITIQILPFAARVFEK